MYNPALLNHDNEIPVPLIKWKQNTLTQLSSKWQPNKDTNANTRGPTLFLAKPISNNAKTIGNIFGKHTVNFYRREKGTNVTNTGSKRFSATIDLADAPGGKNLYANTDKAITGSCNGLQETLDIQEIEPNDQSFLGDVCTKCNYANAPGASSSTSAQNSTFSKQLDAKRRVRSAGMIPRQFQPSRPDNPDPVYFFDNRQYLVSRNRTIAQNSYNYIRKGDPSAQPGTTLAANNVYSPQGLSHCALVKISAATNNNTLSYIWLNGTTYVATIPEGYYNISSFNGAFQKIMLANGHFYTNSATLAPVFLLSFSYNNFYDVASLQAIPVAQVPSPAYTPPAGLTPTQNISQFIIPATTLRQALGVNAGTYPVSPTGITTTQTFLATTRGTLNAPYVTLFYKPSNPQFATQGGVSASNYITRKRYDAITNNGFAYREAYGSAVADAMAYSVSIPGYNTYTLKDKIGYPNKLIPKFPKTRPGVMLKCQPKRLSDLN
jgi:hypothetical protein